MGKISSAARDSWDDDTTGQHDELVADNLARYALNTKTDAAYTLVLSDDNKTVEMNVAGANTVNVPANADVAFPVGAHVRIRQYGAGVTTIAGAGGVTVRSRGGQLKTNGQYAEVSLRKRGTNEWVLSGDTAA